MPDDQPSQPNGSAAARAGLLTPDFITDDGLGRVFLGDCREVVPRIPEAAAKEVDLIFADPPFNWQVKYCDEGGWHDGMPREKYLEFTEQWLDVCVDALADHGSFWVNIPDDTAAEIVVHLKKRGMHMINWCVWHFRFGQNRMGSFIMSKVHALYFAKHKEVEKRIWNPDAVLEPSDRATIYNDDRTFNKKEGTGPSGMRVPMDVWYGKHWGRVQGNNKERRPMHENQLPEIYLERVIRACSNEGSIVLDPFNGSGTTATVARGLKRVGIGVEYSEQLAKSAFERIQRGPVRLGEGLNESTAIFEKRKKGTKSRVAKRASW